MVQFQYENEIFADAYGDRGGSCAGAPACFRCFPFLERISTVFETQVFVGYVLYRCRNFAPLRITAHAESRPHSFCSMKFLRVGVR